MKIGRFAPNLFTEHLVLIHNPNKVIKILSYIYIFGETITTPPPKKFSMVRIRSTVKILSNANVLLNLAAKMSAASLIPFKKQTETVFSPDINGPSEKSNRY